MINFCWNVWFLLSKILVILGLLNEKNVVDEIDLPNGINKKDISKQSKIPVPIKEKTQKPENLEESTIEKQRQKGAIRKQPKNHQNFRQKKPYIRISFARL